MLNADSSALKSESELQRRKTAPTIPSVRALSWTASDDLHDLLDGASREDLLEVRDERGRLVDPAEDSPSSASARKMSGTNDASAK